MIKKTYNSKKLIVLLSLVSFLLMACSNASTNNISSSKSAPAGINSKSSTTVKPPLVGLVDMGAQQPYQLGQNFPIVNLSELGNDYQAFKGIVINETWAQLEPSQGNYDWTDLDNSLSAVNNYNLSHPSYQLSVKFRIFGGKTAPEWAKNLGGSPVTLITGKSRLVGTFGRWWTSSYNEAWSTFLHALASRYDNNSLVRAVAVTSCGSSTGEPFVLSLNGQNAIALENAGWTVQAEESCLKGIFSDYSGFKITPIDLASNPLEVLVNNKASSDLAFTEQIMSKCATSQKNGGPICVLGNNDLSNSVTTLRPASIYSEIDTLWNAKPNSFGVYFQTVAPNQNVGCQAISIAISHHATSVELWPPQGKIPGFSSIPLSSLKQWNSDLISGTPLNC